MENILKGKGGLYCQKKKGIIDFSIYRLKIVNKYGEGNYDASLTAMEKNLKALIKDLNERLKIVSDKKNELRQGKMF